MVQKTGYQQAAAVIRTAIMTFLIGSPVTGLALALALGSELPQPSPPRTQRQKEPAMPPQVVEEPGFTVVGIQALTSNAKEMIAGGIIGKQWTRFKHEHLAAQIPHENDSSIFAVYSDYANDKDGEYSFLIGVRVNSAGNVPAGMVTRKIPAGRYAIFTSEKGPVDKVVPDLWQKIWAIPRSVPGGDRTYKADYEVYDQRAIDPENAQVEIHIGIK